MEILNARDVDHVIITEIKYKDMEDCTKDIVIKFPDGYGMPRISFMEVGLINALPNIEETDDSNEVSPKVAIKFLGKLKTIYE